MDLYFNECSLHGQYQDIPGFVTSLTRLMRMKQLAAQFGRQLYCHRTFATAKVTHNFTLQEVLQQMDRNMKISIANWLHKSGPFWEETRQHPADEYLESNGEIVTDKSLGECAYLTFSGRQGHIASLTPSNWESPQLHVRWHKTDSSIVTTEIQNHIDNTSLEPVLKAAQPTVSSWEQLAANCFRRFPSLEFSEDAFSYLKGCPFHPGVAESFQRRLEILTQLKVAFDSQGTRTTEGQSLYQKFFTGDKAWFSDSSEREKHNFKKELTFRHPRIPDATVFATWHGKIKSPQMRIHFQWNFSANTPVYVVYIGEKLTKT